MTDYHTRKLSSITLILHTDRVQSVQRQYNIYITTHRKTNAHINRLVESQTEQVTFKDEAREECFSDQQVASSRHEGPRMKTDEKF